MMEAIQVWRSQDFLARAEVEKHMRPAEDGQADFIKHQRFEDLVQTEFQGTQERYSSAAANRAATERQVVSSAPPTQEALSSFDELIRGEERARQQHLSQQSQSEIFREVGGASYTQAQPSSPVDAFRNIKIADPEPAISKPALVTDFDFSSFGVANTPPPPKSRDDDADFNLPAPARAPAAQRATRPVPPTSAAPISDLLSPFSLSASPTSSQVPAQTPPPSALGDFRSLFGSSGPESLPVQTQNYSVPSYSQTGSIGGYNQLKEQNVQQWASPVEQKTVQQQWGSPAEQKAPQQQWGSPVEQKMVQPQWGIPIEQQWNSSVEQKPAQQQWNPAISQFGSPAAASGGFSNTAPIANVPQQAQAVPSQGEFDFGTFGTTPQASTESTGWGTSSFSTSNFF